MLPNVARRSSVGIVSGYGVSLGYLGSIVGLLIVQPFVTNGGRSAAFLPTGILFLIFAIPCFLFVKDANQNIFPVNIGKAFITLKKTITNTSDNKILLNFFVVHFLVLDVVNTIIAFMSVYANKVIGLDDKQITSFLMFSTVFAMLGSLLTGWLVKHKGTTFSYWIVLWFWITSLFLIIVSSGETLFWVAGSLAGLGIGGVWVVSRTIIVELSPSEKIGEFFGLYSLTGKVASIIGPLLWGGTVWALQDTQTLKYRAAVGILFLITVIAAFLFNNLQKSFSQKLTE
jgi:UMF1 family MFS transporter